MPFIRLLLPLLLIAASGFAQISLSNQNVPAGSVNVAYNFKLTASGGNGNYSFVFVAGQLPNGVSLGNDGTISGVPTVAGNFSFTVRVKDGTNTADFGLVLNIASSNGVQITTSSLPDGQVGQSYNASLSAAGGSGSYSWALVSGSGNLPPGLTFTSAGSILGTPSAFGNYSFVFRVLDGTGGTAQANLTLRVNSNLLNISTTSLPNGSVGVAYNQNLAASGGVQPYTFGVPSNNFPPGLSLSSGGTISGIPTTVGTTTFTVNVADGANNVANRQLMITIGIAQLSVNQTSLPSGQLGVSYSASVSAVNGTAPYTFSIASGTLPSGISFSGSGVFSGVPQPLASGSFPFSVRVTDSASPNATATASFVIAVNSTSLSISTNALANGVVGQAYNANISASGGQQPYNFQLFAGSLPLPTGLSLNNNGAISGTPLNPGNYSFTVRVADNNNSLAQASLNILVTSNGLSFVSTALPNGQTGQSYNATLTASGGTTPYTYSIQSGGLPPGLVLGAGGVISGVPTTAATYQATYRVQDAALSPLSALVTISISISTGSVVSISTVQLPSARLNQAYNAAVQATGGTAPYSYFVVAGGLPPGIFLSPGGILSGTPNTGGSSNFTIRATDNSTNQAQAAFTIIVNSSGILLSPTNLPTALLNQAYSANFSASGGAAPYTYSVVSGGLPTGIAISSTGAVSGTPTASGNYNFTVLTQDNVGAVASFSVLLVVNSSSLVVNTPTLPTGITGVSYSALITASGGSGPYTFDVTGGALPAGLFITSAGGISGAPSQPGSFFFTIRATDSVSATASATLSINVVSSGTLTITTTSLPQVVVNQNYAVALSAVGGAFPYRYSLASGNLPPGLTLSSSGGISGTPTVPGTYGFVVLLQDNAGASTQASLSILVTSTGIYVSTTALPSAPLGAFYTTTLNAAGGTAPYTWTLVSGSFPNGITLSTNGTLSGVASVSGTYPVTIRVTDAINASAQSSFTLTVGSSFLSFATTTIPQAFIGQQYSVQFAASGGSIPYQFSVAGGSLPTGLQLSSGGLLFGVATVPGITSMVFRVIDSTGTSATLAINLVVGQSTLQITTTTLPSASVGQLYNVSLQATGGTLPYVFSLNSGSLPSGFILSDSGVLSGTTFQVGSYNLTLKVQDSSGASNLGNLTLNVVSGNLQITTTSLPAARLNQPYTATLQSSGGTLPVRFELLSTITVGFPPPGISISPQGVISGTPQSLGSFTFSVRATDAQNLTAQATFTLVVGVGGPTITTTALPGGGTGQAYNQTIAVSGGTTPYVFTLINGSLPTGLSLNSTSGAIAGTPTNAGTFGFSVRVTDNTSLTADATYSITIANNTTAIAISALAPPPGVLFYPYSFALSATGGREPYAWSIPVGPLPNGLRLDAAGNLTGLLLAPGIYRFTARVTDANGNSADATLGITVSGATRLAQARVGSAYSAQVPAPSLGRAPFTYTLNGNALGNLPPGVNLNSDGSFSGTPTASGEFTFGLQATSVSGFRSNLALTIGVTAGNFAVATPGLPGGTAGVPYSQTLAATGGKSPYSWVVSSGSLPNGLNLNPLTGEINGTAPIQGNNFFTVKATDANGAAVFAYYGISIGSAGSPVINAITSAASYGANGIAPGEILTIFGGSIGPATLTSFTLVNNSVPTLLVGTRVLFDGVAAPLIYTQSGQTSVIAPFNLSTKQTVRVVVEYVGFQSTPFLLPVVSSKPGLFTVDGSGQGPGAILNQNGSVNTFSNRAAKESVVVFYLTGGGAMTPAGVDGAVSAATSSLNQQSLALINNQPATVQYSGNAPGLVQGVVQMNVKLPLGTKSGPNDIVVQIGPNSTTANVTVWVE